MTKPALGERTLAVVFGAAVRPDGGASPTLARRTGYAAAIAEADPDVDLFLSGGVGTYPPSEAAVMGALLAGAVSSQRLTLDEVSRDTLQTVRAAAAHARAHRYAAILTCTDAYHQPRVRMLFRLMGFASRAVRQAPRGQKQLRVMMWLRECVAIPYDLVAGLAAAFRDRLQRRRAA
ncbi:YdcF family protein [Sphingomonas sp. RT2P30]|uniref:YdcF family protein n=1 Tax=Parasphingomonas halimpatiens TaxID=3096162 RepID=UPI003FA7C8F9